MHPDVRPTLASLAKLFGWRLVKYRMNEWGEWFAVWQHPLFGTYEVKL